MTIRTVWERVKVDGGQLVDRVKQILDEGNARRVVIKQKGWNVVVFPLTVGLVGVALAPILSAVAGLAALLSECTIEVERVVQVTGSERPARPKTGSRSRRARK